MARVDQGSHSFTSHFNGGRPKESLRGGGD